MKNKYDVLVFDWDGTLMDSEAQIVACMDFAIRENGIEPDPPHQLKRVIGLGLNEAVAELLPEHQSAIHLQVAETYRDRFLSSKKAQSDLFPDVESTLYALHSAGYMLAVATGKSRRGLDKVLQQTGLEDLFVASRCADEAFSKPHPQMLEEIKTDLDVSVERMLMIGDTAFDLQMAANADVSSVGVSYGVHEPEQLQKYEPLIILDYLSELPDWLSSQDE